MVAARDKPWPYQMKNKLFHNDGRKFIDVSSASGPALQLEAVGRGLAIGDLNNDGRVDMIATNNNGQPWVFLNQSAPDSHWLLVQLEGVKTNRDGLGAEVGLLRVRPTDRVAKVPTGWQLYQRRRPASTLRSGRQHKN